MKDCRHHVMFLKLGANVATTAYGQNYTELAHIFLASKGQLVKKSGMNAKDAVRPKIYPQSFAPMPFLVADSRP